MEMSSNIITPLTINELKPFPLPKYLESLPLSVLEEFTKSHDLIKGYIKHLQSYQNFNQSIINQLNIQVNKINEIIKIFENYEATSSKIKEQIHKISSLYQEFLNLETYQYQLLSSNFNQDFLKKKYVKLINDKHEESLTIIKNFNQAASNNFENDFNELIENFKNCRKTYHLRKEKLYRWNEERVSGLI